MKRFVGFCGRLADKPQRVIRFAVTGAAIAALGACTVIDGDRSAQRAGQYGATQAPAPAELEAAVSPDALLPEAPGTPVPMARPASPQPPALAAAPQIELAGRTGVSQLAQDYVQFQNALERAGAAKLDTPRDVRHVLEQLRYAEPNRIARGWIAYRALIAAEDPEFRRGVQARVAAEGRDKVLRKLTGQGVYARRIDGATSASGKVIDAIAADNQKMAQLSERFLSTARHFQMNRWGSLEPLPAQDTGTDVAALEDAGGLLAAVKREFALISTAEASYTPLMEQILAVAARHVIDDADGKPALTETFSADTDSARCLRWARLNLNQCIAAAHFPSEEAWCTGKHAVEDVRMCWVRVLPRSARLEADQ